MGLNGAPAVVGDRAGGHLGVTPDALGRHLAQFSDAGRLARRLRAPLRQQPLLFRGQSSQLRFRLFGGFGGAAEPGFGQIDPRSNLDAAIVEELDRQWSCIMDQYVDEDAEVDYVKYQRDPGTTVGDAMFGTKCQRRAQEP